YPLGNAEFSAHLPKIVAAKPEVLIAVTPGADDIAFLKQAASFGLKKEMKIAQPLHWLPYLKEGGPDLYADIYAGINFSWQLEDSIPEAKNYVSLYRKKYSEPPGDYGAYAYSAIHEVARGIALAKAVNSDAVAPMLVGVFGLLVERFLVRRLYGRSIDDPLLLTFGLSLVLVEAVRLVWGKIGLTLDPPPALAGGVNLGFTYFPLYRLFVIGVTVVVLVALLL